ncbi:G5 domain-containing protein [Bacillus sp. CRN 9]|nr:G5 domain-containing protein [Bacillus sp. CRN 9]
MKKGAKIALAVGSAIALSTTTPGFLNSDYNKAYAATEQTFHTATSVVDWMKANGLDSSFENRKKLAEQNGIVNYKGTASQNIQLLGNVKEDGVQALHTNTSVVDWLKANGLDSSFNNRKALAEKHGIPNYKGSAAQNIQLLSVFKETGVQNNITTNNQAHTESSIVDWMKANGMNSTFSNRQDLANEYGIANYTGTAEQNLKLLGILNGLIPAPEKGQDKVNNTTKPVTTKEEIFKSENQVATSPSKSKEDKVTGKPVKEETKESKTAPTTEKPVVLPVVKPTESIMEKPVVNKPTQPDTPAENKPVVEEPVNEDFSATSILDASGMTKLGTDEYSLSVNIGTDVIVKVNDDHVSSIYYNTDTYIPWKSITLDVFIHEMGDTQEARIEYQWTKERVAKIEKAVRAAADATYGPGTSKADELYNEIIKSEGFSRSFENDPVDEEPVEEEPTTPEEPVEETPSVEPTEPVETPDEVVTEPTQPEESVEEPVVQEPVITYENSTSTEAIAFETVEQQDPTLEKGKTVVAQEGQDGVRTITYKETYKDGKFVSKEQISSEVTKAPVNKIIKVGTKEVVSASNILNQAGVFVKKGSNTYELSLAGTSDVLVTLSGDSVSSIYYNSEDYMGWDMTKGMYIELLGEEEGTKEYNYAQAQRAKIEKAVRASADATYGQGTPKANSLYNEIINSKGFSRSF